MSTRFIGFQVGCTVQKSACAAFCPLPSLLRFTLRAGATLFFVFFTVPFGDFGMISTFFEVLPFAGNRVGNSEMIATSFFESTLLNEEERLFREGLGTTPLRDVGDDAQALHVTRVEALRTLAPNDGRNAGCIDARQGVRRAYTQALDRRWRRGVFAHWHAPVVE